jgi:hypothetical protein
MRQNGMKFSIDQKAEFKRSLALYRQILARVLIKDAMKLTIKLKHHLKAKSLSVLNEQQIIF